MAEPSRVAGSTAERPRLVFFGSGPVAAASLELLLEWADVEAVITKPQPPHHKQPFPVLSLAAKAGLKTFTPNSKAELSALFADKPVSSQLGVIIDYGFIVNQDVIDYFPMGIVNSHFSLLPEWRGADPISFSILSGQQQTGVSLMLLVEAMDEGPLLAQSPFDLPTDITTPELTEELIKLSDSCLQSVLPLYLADKATPLSQAEIIETTGEQPTYSRKLSKADGILDFTKPAEQLEREVRAFIEWPKSRMVLGGKDVVVTKAHAVPDNPTGTIGKITADRDGGVIAVETSRGTFCIEKLKPAGKPEMTATAFLAGNQLH